jgi:hypothetical protein
MLKKLLVALALVLPLDAHAVPWEVSYTGTALLPNGQRGQITAIYTWDAAAVTRVDNGVIHNACLHSAVTWSGYAPCGGAYWHEHVTGSLSYSGIANGYSDGVPMTIFADGGEIWRSFGRTWSWSIGPLSLSHPREFDGDVAQWDFVNLQGGEDGWSWYRASRFDPESVLHLSLRRVPEPGTLALAFLSLTLLVCLRRSM